MSYAALMVHFDARRSGERRVRLAVDLAHRFHALLIGIAGRSYLPPFLAEDTVGDAERDDGERREMTQLLADMEKQFRAAAKNAKQVEWRGILDDANNLVPREARAADLVIIGRKQDPRDLYYSLDPGITILRAGRPVLLVPDAIDSLPARRVVVAWKDTRECRRAVRDALPFLKEASEIMIATVSEHGTGAQAKPSIDDVENYLVRHQSSVGAKVYLHAKQSIATELLRFAEDERADLIVAGGYGHSRLGEWALGGVTRELLSDSPICCLFSH
jgi:nucleotide-binding universal stress UspA family protein